MPFINTVTMPPSMHSVLNIPDTPSSIHMWMGRDDILTTLRAASTEL